MSSFTQLLHQTFPGLKTINLPGLRHALTSRGQLLIGKPRIEEQLLLGAFREGSGERNC